MIAAGVCRTRDRERDPRLVQGPVVGIDEFNQNLVWPGRKALEDDWIAARICPVPAGVIDCYVNVPNPWRNGERC